MMSIGDPFGASITSFPLELEPELEALLAGYQGRAMTPQVGQCLRSDLIAFQSAHAELFPVRTRIVLTFDRSLGELHVDLVDLDKYGEIEKLWSAFFKAWFGAD